MDINLLEEKFNNFNNKLNNFIDTHFNLFDRTITKMNQFKNHSKNLRSLLKNIKKLYFKKFKIKGQLCSINGSKYEKEIFNIVNNCYIKNIKFNNQNISDIGGSTIKNDLICCYKKNDIGIEIKKHKAPDWMQCSLHFNIENKKWQLSNNSKLPIKCIEIFDKYINELEIFNNNIPPFFNNKITHKEWLEIKKSTNIWNDQYFDIPNNIISKLYQGKKCYYIQISDYGLYHLGNDICKFNVPYFEIEQQLRIRIKIHCKNTSKGFCQLSVTCACQPKNIKNLTKSKFTLDDKEKLPINLNYQN